MLRALRIIIPLISVCMLTSLNGQSLCNGKELLKDVGFGTGTEAFPPITPSFGSSFIQVFESPDGRGEYTITNHINNIKFPFANTFWLDDVQDISTPNGYFMVINADYTTEHFYADSVDFCAGNDYIFSFDAISLIQSSFTNFQNPRIRIAINGVLHHSTNNIMHDETWHSFSFTHRATTTERVEIKLILSVPNGEFHDIAIDNISLIECRPELNIDYNATPLCLGETTTLTATVDGNQPTSINWEFYNGSNWTSLGHTGGQLPVTLAPETVGMYRATFTEGGCLILQDTAIVETFPGGATADTTKIIDSICVGTQYTFNGQVFGSGNHILPLTDANGCDSIIYLQVNTIQTDTVKDVQNVCAGFIFDGISLQSDTIINQSQTSPQGCAQIISHEFRVSQPVTVNNEHDICAGESFQSITINNDTTIVQNLIGSNGCDSTVVHEITAHPQNQETVNHDMCLGDSLVIPNQTIFTAGTYTGTFQNQFGCDSIVQYVVSVFENERDTQFIHATGDTTINGVFIDSDTTFVETTTTSVGCERVVVWIVTVPKLIVDRMELSDCDAVEFNGQTYTRDTVLFDTVNLGINLDSVSITEITITPEITADTISQALCAGEIYEGITINNDTTIVQNLIGSNGCDSTVVHEITAHPQNQETVIHNMCLGDSLVIPNQTIFTAGTYTGTFQNQFGCDSIVQYVVSVFENERDTQFIHATGDTTINGVFVDSDTTLVETTTTSVGCERVVVWIVTVPKLIVDRMELSDCDAVEFNGQTYTRDTVLFDTVNLGINLDSVSITEITITPELKTDTIFQSICTGETYDFMGNSYNQSGTYEHPLNSANGCDSLVVLELLVHPNNSERIAETICAGDSLQIGGIYYGEAGLDTLHLQNQWGCDSTVFIEIIILDTLWERAERYVCPGGSVQFNDSSYTVGEHTIISSTDAGCKQTTLLTVVERTNLVDSVELEICEGDSILIGSSFEKTAGFYSESFSAQTGCDSLVIYELIVYDTYIDSQEVIVGNDTLINGEIISQDTIITDTYQTVEGCDSIIITTFRFKDFVFDTVRLQDCKPIEVEGITYTQDTSFSKTIEVNELLDSTVTTFIDIIEQTQVDTIERKTCVGSFINYEGNTYPAGIFELESVTDGGCIQKEILRVTEIVIEEVRETLLLCEGETIQLGNRMVSTPGEYSVVSVSSKGCDSTTILDVRYEAYKAGFSTHQVCPGETFMGVTVQGDTSLVDTLASQIGCDSIHTYFIDIYTPSDLTIEASSALYCEGGTVSLTANGSYTSLKWSNGATTSSISVAEAQQLQVEAIDENGCSMEASYIVPPPIRLTAAVRGNDPTCFGESDGSIQFESVKNANGAVQFSIDNGNSFQPGEYFTDLSHGRYFVKAQDELGCTFTDTITLNQPEFLELGIANHTKEATIEIGESYEVELYTNKESEELQTILWTPENTVSCDTCLRTTLSPLKDTEYVIFVVDTAGCTAEQTFLLQVIADYTINFPNIFTPNGDDLHDSFYPIITGNFVEMVETFAIYDRWGEQLFEKNDLEPYSDELKWDGSYMGYMMNPGVFVYYAEIRLKDGTTKIYKGDVTIAR